jgi:hypothetical protein
MVREKIPLIAFNQHTIVKDSVTARVVVNLDDQAGRLAIDRKTPY